MSQTRDSLAETYLAQLPYPPYPVQEEALLAWFTAEQGVLVCAPTGTGKTMIAQAALYEALHTGSVAYYTTPLIALTEQKFQEMQASAVRWGFRADDVGLVTGNRRVNPDARVLVVVAEILLNRLLNPGAFDFSKVFSVVMDEFHSFADQERGIVWELSLGMLPRHVRLLLLSATVGNAREFLSWLSRSHNRKLELVESKDRKIPLEYNWVPDQFLTEHLVEIAKGDGDMRKVPALVFCFNRDECWSLAETLKGLPLLAPHQKTALHAEINRLQWKEGVGPKIKEMLHRGVGVHHAGLLPKYRRVVEDLFTRKLLAVCICTETLASGINLPARSVVLGTLVKGPTGKQKLVDASTAQQIFGRAGRPQFDDRGYVFALAPEDDVKMLRWKEKYDSIPEKTGDPGLIRAKKALKKKKPTRSETRMYWNESQFKMLQGAPPGKLYSKGYIPWRLLAYLLSISPEVDRVRVFARKRLMDDARIRAGEKVLNDMLVTLARGGFVTLDPPPPPELLTGGVGPELLPSPPGGEGPGVRGQGIGKNAPSPPSPLPQGEAPPPQYAPVLAAPTEKLHNLLVFRSIHPLYGAFLLEHLGIADRHERLQALESVLEIPRPILKFVRIPPPDDLPPGPLQRTRLDEDLIRRGLVTAQLIQKGRPAAESEEEDDDDDYDFERPPSLADKLFLLFETQYPEVTDLHIQSVWAAGELLRFNGDFNKYVQYRGLVKQEGIIFRHLLRLILLCGEFAQLCPADISPQDWQNEMKDIADRLTASCREVDPTSTDEMIERAHSADVVEGETALPLVQPT